MRSILAILVLTGSLFLSTPGARAIDCNATPGDPSCSQTATVTATVVSNVSTLQSSVVTDLAELPADGVSSVLVTVTLKEAGGTALVGKDVTISSNRGSVDVFSVYVGVTLQLGFSGQSDANGQIKFTVRSVAPGQMTLTAVADTVTLADKPTVTFTPLPLLTNLTVTVALPGKTPKKITLITPSQPKPSEQPSPSNQNEPASDKLVNTQVELQISFWTFLLLIIVLIASPFLFVTLLILIRKLRLLLLAARDKDKREEDLLAQIYKLEQQLASDQKTDIGQNQQLSQQLAQSKEEIKETVASQVEETFHEIVEESQQQPPAAGAN